MKVAFVGLGVMGRPMARNLVSAGHEVTAFTRTHESRERARAVGITTVDRIDALPADVDAVVTVLPDGPDVEAVLLSDELALRPGTLAIDMSTIAPRTARALSKTLAARDVRFLDAPVSGGEAGAVEGVLSVMVGGSADDFAAARTVFEAVGETVVLVGPAGAGQVVKAANQLIVAGNLQLIAEAMVFVDAHGVDREQALSVLSGGLAGSTVMTRKRDNYLARSYEPGFRLALHNKDLGIVDRAAREEHLALPVTAVVSQLVQSLIRQGHGDLDHSALYLLAEQLSPVVRTTGGEP